MTPACRFGARSNSHSYAFADALLQPNKKPVQTTQPLSVASFDLEECQQIGYISRTRSPTSPQTPIRPCRCPRRLRRHVQRIYAEPSRMTDAQGCSAGTLSELCTATIARRSCAGRSSPRLRRRHRRKRHAISVRIRSISRVRLAGTSSSSSRDRSCFGSKGSAGGGSTAAAARDGSSAIVTRRARLGWGA